MKFTQYYLDCLSQASYLVGDRSSGRAVVVDPRRDIDEYVQDADAAGLRIELVLETHFHADFLSGHLELAAATGAEIGFSSVAEPEFAVRKFDDDWFVEFLKETNTFSPVEPVPDARTPASLEEEERETISEPSEA